MTWYVSINRGVIDSNRKHGTKRPPITYRRGKSGLSSYCNELELPAGSRVVYDGGEPILKCGARVVIACPTEPKEIR